MKGDGVPSRESIEPVAQHLLAARWLADVGTACLLYSRLTFPSMLHVTVVCELCMQKLRLGWTVCRCTMYELPRRSTLASRFDFATEEEYNEYKSEQEANPKAKGGDGRRAARALENRGKQKLDNQLNKIERIFEEKGFGNAGAFAKPEATPSRRPAPVEDSVQPGAKKRRI